MIEVFNFLCEHYVFAIFLAFFIVVVLEMLLKSLVYVIGLLCICIKNDKSEEIQKTLKELNKEK